MRKYIFLLLILVCIKSQAQQFDDGRTDNIILRIPAEQTTSTGSIAAYVKQNFDIDRKKVRAIYTWVTSNIKYSTDSANIINLGTDHEAKITVALRRRKGVCENFAAIFNDICLKSGLTSFVIDGYTKQDGTVDHTGHSWCAVLVDNTWQLCDPTWDATPGTHANFFLIPASAMIESHMPYDPMWQLLDHPVSHEQFYSGNFYTKKNQPLFNFADTVAAYIKMDSLQRFRSTAYRIEQSGTYNKLVKNSLDIAKMNVEMIRQDNDVDLYNSSVEDLNAAMNIYNNFVQYRNMQFTPAKTDDELKSFLDGIDAKLTQAHKKLDQVEKSQATFQIGTQEVRNKLNSLATRVKDQKEFLTLYLNTPKVTRASLFYSKPLSVTGK